MNKQELKKVESEAAQLHKAADAAQLSKDELAKQAIIAKKLHYANQLKGSLSMAWDDLMTGWLTPEQFIKTVQPLVKKCNQEIQEQE